jgi:hypothetical protein
MTKTTQLGIARGATSGVAFGAPSVTGPGGYAPRRSERSRTALTAA